MLLTMRFGFILMLAPVLSGQTFETLEQQVQSTAGSFTGTVSLFAKNLDTGKTLGLRENERVRTASTIKLGILAATFAAVEQGKLHWTDVVTLHDSDKISGSGILTEFSEGDQLPLRDLSHLMIVVSDNTATNLILNRVTGDFVNAQMDKLGLKNTRSMRNIRGDGTDLKAATGFSRAGRMPGNEKFGIGSTTPQEMVMLIEKIERGEVVSAAASQEMLRILKRQQDRNGIARKMGDLVVANKSGALDQMRADVGIVYSPGGRIALAIYCDNIPKVDWSSDNPGLLMIARLAEMLVKGLAK